MRCTTTTLHLLAALLVACGSGGNQSADADADLLSNIDASESQSDADLNQPDTGMKKSDGLQWVARFAGRWGNEVHDIDMGGDGSIYSVGALFSEVDIEPGSAHHITGSYPDIFLARHSADGQVLWSRGGNNNANTGASAIDFRDGFVAMGGYGAQVLHLNKGLSDETTIDFVHGPQNAFVALYDESGNLQWVRGDVDSSGTSKITDVAILADGSVVALGEFSRELAMQGTPLSETFNIALPSAPGSRDIFVICYSASGEFRWVRGLHSNNYEVAHEVEPHPSDGVVISGYLDTGLPPYEFLGEETNVTLERGGHFLAHYADDGTLLSAERVLTHANARRPMTIEVLSDGSVLMAGAFSSTATFMPERATFQTLTTVRDTDGYAARLTPAGNLSWLRHFPVDNSAPQAPGSNFDGITSMGLSGDHLLVGGHFEGMLQVAPGQWINSEGGSTGVAIALNPTSGNTRWIRTMGGQGDDKVMAVAAGAGNRSAVAGFFGHSDQPATFGVAEDGESILQSEGEEDGFVALFQGAP
jgi:hypothetical protein